MGNYKIEEMEKSAEQEYIDYIDRCIRTNHKSRLEIHNLLNTRNVGLYYGLSEKRLNELTKIFEDEEKIKE